MSGQFSTFQSHVTCDVLAYNENQSSSIMDEDLEDIAHCQDDEDDEKCQQNWKLLSTCVHFHSLEHRH